MNAKFIWIKDIRTESAYYVQMFGVREISKELGGAIYNDNCDEWLLAVQGETLLGFSGYDLSKSGSFTFKRSYVYPAYRRLGLYRIMFNMRMDRAKELNASVLIAKTTVKSREVFQEAGFFTLDKLAKRFVVYRKIISK